MAITQDNRLLGLMTNAGKDVLLLDSFSGQEAISQPFQFFLRMVSEVDTGNPAKVNGHDLVGTSFTVRVGLSTPGEGLASGYRYWTGMCDHFVKERQDYNFAYYSAVIVPWISFLGYATNCRIFQDKDVETIIKEVVAVHGYGGLLRSDLKKTYAKRAYCVQYRETDFSFLSRLMEDEGIYYYFEHENGKHTMVLADSIACYRDLPYRSKFKYSPVTGVESTEDTITDMQVLEGMHAGRWTTRDFHHESPSNRLERTETAKSVPAEGKKFEVYHPGSDAKFFNKVSSFGGAPDEAEKTVRTRMEREEASQKTISGLSKCREFTTGFKIDVEGGDASGPHLLASISHHSFQLPGYRADESVRPGYGNSFRCIPADVVFVPPLVTGRTVIYGLQTAFIIDESPSGNTEEIWPDKYGRVRVRFHWDREAKYACWVRVLQPWAGKAWGQQWIPRVGDEVAITFLEGDPDLPLVMGGVYNSTNMPVFALPDNKTQSGILTRSSKGGSSENYNMLRFEDKIGNEEIHVQAEKDLNSLIKYNESRTVGNDRTSAIHVNDTRTVEKGEDKVDVQTGSRTVTVKQNIINEAKSGFIKVIADSSFIEVSSPTRITLTCGGSKIEMTPGEIKLTQGGTTVDLQSALLTQTSGLIKLNS